MLQTMAPGRLGLWEARVRIPSRFAEGLWVPCRLRKWVLETLFLRSDVFRAMLARRSARERERRFELPLAPEPKLEIDWKRLPQAMLPWAGRGGENSRRPEPALPAVKPRLACSMGCGRKTHRRAVRVHPRDIFGGNAGREDWTRQPGLQNPALRKNLHSDSADDLHCGDLHCGDLHCGDL